MAHSFSRESIPEAFTTTPTKRPNPALASAMVVFLASGWLRCVFAPDPNLHPQTMTNPQESRSFRLIAAPKTHIGVVLAIAFAALLTVHFSDRSRPETTSNLTAMQTVQQPAVLK